MKQPPLEKDVITKASGLKVWVTQHGEPPKGTKAIDEDEGNLEWITEEVEVPVTAMGASVHTTNLSFLRSFLRMRSVGATEELSCFLLEVKLYDGKSRLWWP